MLKLSIAYSYGWKAIGTLVYSAPQALEKAKAADRIVRERLQQLGLKFEEIYTEFFGVNACHGPVARARIPIRRKCSCASACAARIRKAVDRFTRELIPLVLSGPPTGTGFGDGRPPVREVVAYWPALIPRELIQTSVEVVE